MPDTPSLESFATQVSEGTPAPGGGAVAAVTGALAAALAAMVARVALARPAASEPEGLRELVESADRVRLRLLELRREDEAAYPAVIEAKRSGDAAALRAAWQKAARVPAEVIRSCRDVALLARRAARDGPPSAVSDAVMAGLLAAAAAAGSHLNLRFNTRAAGRPEDLRVLTDQSEVLLRETQRAAGETRLLAEEQLDRS